MGATAAEDLKEEILRKKAEKRVGSTLREKWHLDSLIGIGGMGAVYRATHRNGMRGAVKILHLERAADEAVKRRFLREGYLANKVDHPGAVRILDDDEAEGTVFLVMELLEGVTLEDHALREGGVLDVERVTSAFDQVLATLAAAHAKGIVHRDIKPANLFLAEGGVVKILDYGIAGIAEPLAAGPGATQDGIGMGTPSFMAPEQARGRWSDVDARSDLWSVGASMFALLSGTTVHDEGTVQELLAATFMVQARSLHAVAPDVPDAIAAVVDRALRLDKTERWPSAMAMRDALLAALSAPSESGRERIATRDAIPIVAAPRAEIAPAETKTTLSATETSSVPASPSPRRSRTSILGVMIAVLILTPLAFLGGSMLRRPPPAAASPASPASPSAELAAPVAEPPAEKTSPPASPPATPASVRPAPFAAAPRASFAAPVPAAPASASASGARGRGRGEEDDAGKRPPRPGQPEDSIF